MQDQQLGSLVDTAFDRRLKKPETIQKKMEKIEGDNRAALKDLPDYERTPTAEELTKFRQWAVEYKKQMPGASKRQVRKAVQEHFHIRIYK